MITAIYHPEAIEAAWQLLIATCQDHRRDTARDILAVMEKENP